MRRSRLPRVTTNGGTMISKSFVAAMVASLAVVLSAAPASAAHSADKYCDSKNAQFFKDAGYCKE